MAYDAARGVTVLFGGYTSSSAYVNDTWSGTARYGLEEGQRSRRQPIRTRVSCPVLRCGRGVTVLFAAAPAEQLPERHLGWNGTVWTQRTLNGAATSRPRATSTPCLRPGSRRDRPLRRDRQWRQQRLMSDTWSGTGRPGTQLTFDYESTSPLPRDQHSMVYDRPAGDCPLRRLQVSVDGLRTTPGCGTDRLDEELAAPSTAAPSNRIAPRWIRFSPRMTVLFGGYTPSYVNDTWEWSGTIWTSGHRMARRRARPPVEYAMAYDSGRGSVSSSAGPTAAPRTTDTWEWNERPGIKGRHREPDEPSERSMHAMAYDAAGGDRPVRGSTATALENDTWEWDGRPGLSDAERAHEPVSASMDGPGVRLRRG